MSIKDRAMLVTLSIAYWTGKASDDRVLDEVHKKHNIEKGAQEYRKLLVNPEAINAVKAVRSRARTYHFEKTLPWIDGGTRILPAAFYFEYAEKMREFKGEYDIAIAEFLKNYSKLKGEARKRLGSLYRDEDYPSAEILRRKFGWDMTVLPIPSGNDWRVSLGGKAEAEVRKQIEEKVKAAMATATRDLWQRLYVVVEALSVKMKEAEPRFRDSIIGNIRELVAMLPDMNVAGDAKLEEMRKQVEVELAKLSLDDLRDDAKSRKKTADAADAILAKMAGYIGEK